MSEKTVQRADEFLFAQGLTIENYFIELTPVSEMICYRNSEGREFDLPINDPDLYDAAVLRLKELGVRIVRLGLE
ncbi:hypothetical protein CFB40_16095 [Burkholderia sp. AU31652]|uniref:hypothetical protein n=1 Tax=Burkholderia sp. AU31652 TaxID=2015354 RepID=UPI000B7ABAF2|nr:hypothetical protein [Burkholderia sp. AU31652]OXI87195.1 hypothetical protein CFB40_16095 [Burkholderia sp. AU31652]